MSGGGFSRLVARVLNGEQAVRARLPARFESPASEALPQVRAPRETVRSDPFEGLDASIHREEWRELEENGKAAASHGLSRSRILSVEGLSPLGTPGAPNMPATTHASARRAAPRATRSGAGIADLAARDTVPALNSARNSDGVLAAGARPELRPAPTAVQAAESASRGVSPTRARSLASQPPPPETRSWAESSPTGFSQLVGEKPPATDTTAAPRPGATGSPAPGPVSTTPGSVEPTPITIEIGRIEVGRSAPQRERMLSLDAYRAARREGKR